MEALQAKGLKAGEDFFKGRFVEKSLHGCC
jgi:hypothetical protein